MKRRLSWRELREEVSRAARALLDAGVTVGDRVAAVMPNMPETVIAMLATASLGATFTSCSPDFGVQGVVDRFGQIGPTVLFACDNPSRISLISGSISRLTRSTPSPSVRRAASPEAVLVAANS